MKKNLFLVLVFLVVQLISVAQKTKPKFSSINQFGVAWGATGDALQLQTVNGVAFKTFFAGLGIGLDYYWERTIPVFFDFRKELFKKSQTPFLYADLGVNMPWVNTGEDNQWYKSTYANGSYLDAGVGYKLAVNKRLFANMSFGFTQKTFKEDRTNQVILFDFAPSQQGTQNYEYTLRRFSLKVGLSF